VPQLRLAEAQAAGGGAAYVYEFTWRTPVLDGRLQSPHGVEVPFVFGSTAAASDFVGAAPPAALTARMQDVWIGFARTGEPPAPDGSRWPAYSATSRATWMLDLTPRRETDPAGDDLRAWDGVPFDSLSPAVDPLASAL
jgi:para-nitrobenzyl esterase